MSAASQNPSFSLLISVKGTGKNQLPPGQETMRDVPVLSRGCLVRHPRPKPSGVLEHCREGSPIYKAFPSELIPKATKDLNVHFLTVLQFTSCNNSCKLYQRIT
jgi:hypothetical protein